MKYTGRHLGIRLSLVLGYEVPETMVVFLLPKIFKKKFVCLLLQVEESLKKLKIFLLAGYCKEKYVLSCFKKNSTCSSKETNILNNLKKIYSQVTINRLSYGGRLVRLSFKQIT